MARTLVINSEIQIPANEITMSFTRSAGPGGQNVNKVNTKALLRWNVTQSTSLPHEVKSRFLERYATRITRSGDLVLSSDRHREQLRNVSDCYEKLRQLVQSVVRAPRRRVATRPSRGSVERRLQKKRITGKRKSQRQFRPGEDD